MIVSYNKRKQGKRYMKENFGVLINEAIKSDDVYGADPSGKGFNKALLTKWYAPLPIYVHLHLFHLVSLHCLLAY